MNEAAQQTDRSVSTRGVAVTCPSSGERGVVTATLSLSFENMVWLILRWLYWARALSCSILLDSTRFPLVLLVFSMTFYLVLLDSA